MMTSSRGRAANAGKDEPIRKDVRTHDVQIVTFASSQSPTADPHPTDD